MGEDFGVASSRARDVDDALRELQSALPDRPDLVLIFHASSYDPGEVARVSAATFPGARVLGCTAMGELGPAGLTEGAMSALAIRGGVRVVARAAPVDGAFHNGLSLLAEMTAELGVTSLRPERHLIVLLADGGSHSEERIAAALGQAAPTIAMVGGSASDALHMDRVAVWMDGEPHPRAHLVLLLELDRPFKTVHVHHYTPTERRVVVTRADPLARKIWEIDGWPALRVFRGLVAADEVALQEDSWISTHQSVQFGYSVGDEFFIRSAMQVEGDALLMAGPVEEGAVLRVMIGEELVQRTHAGIEEALEDFQSPVAGMLLFNCGGRLLEARSSGQVEALYDAMAQAPAAGFSTYGEQMNGLHVNHTLTGVIFGVS